MRATQPPGAAGSKAPATTDSRIRRPMRTQWRWLRASLGAGVWRVVLLAAIQATMALIAVSYALLMQGAVDAAVGGDARGFASYSTAFGAALIVQVGLGAALSHLTEAARASFDNGLRGTVFAALLGQDANGSPSRLTGDLMSVLTSDVMVVSSGLTSLPMTVSSMVVRMAGVLVLMALLAPGLAVLFLVAGLVFAVGSTLLRRRIGGLHLRVQEAEARVRSLIQECLEGLTVIRAFGVERKAEARVASLMGEHARERVHKNDVATLANSGFNLVMQAAFLVGFVWCGHGILEGTSTAGTLVAVIQLVGQIRGPLASASGIGLTLASTSASVERLMDAVEQSVASPRRLPTWLPAEGSAASEGAGAAAPDSVASTRAGKGAGEACASPTATPSRPWVRHLYARLESIRFEDVTFAYAGRAGTGETGSAPTIEHFSAQVPKGSFCVVTGPSGVGKSTLLRLLMGLERADGGHVALCCDANREVDVATLPAGMFAYVPQGNGLMSGTIAEAVALSGREAAPDLARVRAACQTACASEFVEELPLGYETPLGEHGHGLSEGQMQRLAVARALYSAAPILILDESTSALDADTECRLLDSIRALSDVTVFIVTHRPRAVSLCDVEIHLTGRQEGSLERGV